MLVEMRNERRDVCDCAKVACTLTSVTAWGSPSLSLLNWLNFPTGTNQKYHVWQNNNGNKQQFKTNTTRMTNQQIPQPPEPPTSTQSPPPPHKNNNNNNKRPTTTAAPTQLPFTVFGLTFFGPSSRAMT